MKRKRKLDRMVRNNIIFTARCLAIAASIMFLIFGTMIETRSCKKDFKAARAGPQPTVYRVREAEEISEGPAGAATEMPETEEAALPDAGGDEAETDAKPGENLEHPFDAVPLDFGSGDLEGFVEYELPEGFEDGYLPVEVQEYAYVICKEYGVDYPLVLAMIEVESGYHWDAKSSCHAVGYMQIVERWHGEDMKAAGTEDLWNPYQNIRTGIHILDGFLKDHQTSVALTIYNRGYRNGNGTGAIDLVEKGQYTTEYSEKVMGRAEEIGKELRWEK